MMKMPDRSDWLLFGGTFLLANKMQVVGDKMVEGLSTKQWFLIRTIMDLPADPPPTITQIARETDSTRQNVTKMLEIMEREGLVAIEDDASDRRSRCVRMTEQGISNTKRITEAGQQFLEHLFLGIEPSALDAAAKVMVQMVQNLMHMQEKQGIEEASGADIDSQ